MATVCQRWGKTDLLVSVSGPRQVRGQLSRSSDNFSVLLLAVRSLGRRVDHRCGGHSPLDRAVSLVIAAISEHVACRHPSSARC